MPRVPLSSGPELRATPQQGGYRENVDVSAPARQLGQALGRVGEAAGQVAIRDAETKANTVDTETTGQWLAKDAELRRQFRGANADQYQAEAAKWWQEKADSLGKDLDPITKSMISKTLGRRQSVALGQVAQHVEVEKDRHADDVAQANIGTTIQFGVTSGDVAGAANRVRQLAAEVGARKGWTTEQVQAEQGKSLSALHVAQISRLAESDAAAAQTYYQAHKDEVGFAQQPRIEQVLKAETDNQFATQKAASLATLPFAEQIKAAGEITDPQQREKTLTQIKANRGLAIAAKQEQEKLFSDQAWQLVGQGKKVPEAILTGMDGRERVQLQDHIRQRAEHAALQGSKPVKTDPATLAKVYDLMRDKPDEFKSMRMESLTYKLAGSDIEQVARIQRDMLDPAKEKDAISLSMQIGAYSRGMKREDRALFESSAQAEVIQFQQQNKRPPNSKERQEILDRLKLEGITDDGWLWDTKKKRYKMTPEELATAKFPGQAASGEQFTTGQVYRDAAGNRAKYLGAGKWEPVK